MKFIPTSTICESSYRNSSLTKIGSKRPFVGSHIVDTCPEAFRYQDIERTATHKLPKTNEQLDGLLVIEVTDSGVGK